MLDQHNYESRWDGEGWHRIVACDDLPEGEMAACEIGDTLVALYNVGGSYFATSNVCTHAFAILTDGWLEDDVIECPLHGGQFNVCTGKALADPAETDLKTYQVRVVDGFVEVRMGKEE